MLSIVATAPGKIIISGEHSVVYGYPALVASVNLYLTTTLKDFHLDIQSGIPIGAGLGSSAALAATKATVILKQLNIHPTKKLINQLAFEQEKSTHANPSGVDNTAVVYGGWLKYQKPNHITRFNKLNFPQVVLINSGRPIETTAQMVDYVKKQKSPPFSQIAECTNTIINILSSSSPNFNQLNSTFHTNEVLLEQLDVISKSTQKIIRNIEQSGGVAKVCGAGGRKTHSGILLCLHRRPQILITLAQKLKLKYFYPVRLGVPGISLRTQSSPHPHQPATAATPQ